MEMGFSSSADLCKESSILFFGTHIFTPFRNVKSWLACITTTIKRARVIIFV